MKNEAKNDELIQLAKKVKDECINTALEAYANASGDGLCCEGAWECAVEAIRNLDSVEIISRVNSIKRDI